MMCWPTYIEHSQTAAERKVSDDEGRRERPRVVIAVEELRAK